MHMVTKLRAAGFTFETVDKQMLGSLPGVKLLSKLKKEHNCRHAHGDQAEGGWPHLEMVDKLILGWLPGVKVLS